jgi:hypothetical protein
MSGHSRAALWLSITEIKAHPDKAGGCGKIGLTRQGKRVIFFEMPLSRFRETGKDEMNHDVFYARQYEDPRPKTRVFF